MPTNIMRYNRGRFGPSRSQNTLQSIGRREMGLQHSLAQVSWRRCICFSLLLPQNLNGPQRSPFMMERTSSQKQIMRKRDPRRFLRCPHLFSNPGDVGHSQYYVRWRNHGRRRFIGNNHRQMYFAYEILRSAECHDLIIANAGDRTNRA